MPWIEYGIVASGEFNSQVFHDEFQLPPGGSAGGPDIMGYVRSGAEILKCFRGYSAVTFQDNEVQVTHGHWHFEDLK